MKEPCRVAMGRISIRHLQRRRNICFKKSSDDDSLSRSFGLIVQAAAVIQLLLIYGNYCGRLKVMRKSSGFRLDTTIANQ
jgi:hypothetical protein